MGAITHSSSPQPATAATTTTSTTKVTSRPVRPGLITASGQNISYRSKSGRTLTFEFSAPSSNNSADNKKTKKVPGGGAAFAKLSALTAVLPPVDDAKSEGAKKSDGSARPTATSAVSSRRLPEKAQLVVRSSTVDVNDKEANPGVLLGIYDTLSFWCMEAVEVACWGPYDEAVATPAPALAAKAFNFNAKNNASNVATEVK